MEYKTEPNQPHEINKILNPIVRKWFDSKFKEFSLPQKLGVLEIHSRKNVLISAPTGATKTLTAFMSVLNELVDSSEKGILEDRCYCVYISPLKALNYDIEHNLKTPLIEMEELYGKKLNIRVAVRTGDTTATEKSQMLRKPPHILITTPESLAIMLTSPKFSNILNNVSWCIIDEIHALAENKRGTHLSLSLENLEKKSGHMTRVGLSATIAPIESVAAFLVGYSGDELRPCIIIDVQFIKEQEIKVIAPVGSLIDTTHEILNTSLYETIHKLVMAHNTTVIFTNTRAATERVVDYLKHKYPKSYTDSNIGAHHGSLSKELRFQLESALRAGTMKCVVSSTSLELGIDIGSIDLVILLGSPKSVARALQRIGRSGHRLNQIAKGRIIVLDRDDMVENSVLLKNALEKHIDRIHIPTNCLDVLSQQIIGILLQDEYTVKDLYEFVKKSYPYHNLKYDQYMGIIEYLAGLFASLEDRHVYAKISFDQETGILRKKGKLTRVIYMTNIGTIPDESFISVNIGNYTIGSIDEGFLEKMRPGDIFILGGSTYQFKYTRGMVAYVTASSGRPPTVPSWYSEMLPLSFDLALSIGKFRRMVKERFIAKEKKSDIIDFIKEYLHCEEDIANNLHDYVKEQFDFSIVPDDKTILIEHYVDEHESKYIFHTLFGRRVNDCLSRAIAFAIGRSQHKDVEIGINDNGFYISGPKGINPKRAFEQLCEQDLRKIMELAIEKTELLKRRFRHCAARSFMILRNYMGKTKRAGKQQMYSTLLFTEVKRISEKFPILVEARREVLEDLMDIGNATLIANQIKDKRIKIVSTTTNIPSPFAFQIVIQGLSDILKMEDKLEFLKRMHTYVLVKIALDAGKKKPAVTEEPVENEEDDLRFLAYNLVGAPLSVREDLVKLIDGADEIRKDSKIFLRKHGSIVSKWPVVIKELLTGKELI